MTKFLVPCFLIFSLKASQHLKRNNFSCFQQLENSHVIYIPVIKNQTPLFLMKSS